MAERQTADRHVLVVEDDIEVRGLIQRSLTRAGFRVTALPSAAKVNGALAAGGVDLVIIDLGLPDADGLSLTRQIREHYSVGVIIVSGRGETVDRIVGLEVGADDYLAKPFEPRELVARARSVLRRKEQQSESVPTEQRLPTYVFNDWKLDCSARALFEPNGSRVSLTSGEYKLLEVMVSRANRVLSRDQLLDLTSMNDAPSFDRSIDVRIGRLRRKLGDSSTDPRIINTVRNGGYIFIAKVDRA
jgi:two-component system OmpR family response regulator